MACRLTALYALLFALVSLSVFLLTLFALSTHLKGALDEDLHEDLDELARLYQAEGGEALAAEFLRESSSDGMREVFYALVSLQGEVVIASDLSAWPAQAVPPDESRGLAAGEGRFATVAMPENGGDARVFCKRIDDRHLLCLGETLEEIDDITNLVGTMFAVDIMIMVLFGAGIGWFVAQRAMSGITRVTETAVRIGRHELSERVDVGNEGLEIEDLAVAFNEMLSRIAGLISEMKDVADNIAHDLRSPITRLRGVAETTLTGESSIDDYRDMAAIVVEESDYMIRLINTLLDIAENDSGLVELKREPIDLVQLLVNASELFQPLADKKGVSLVLAEAPEEATVYGDSSRLQRVVSNLLDNALKFTPPGGEVRLQVWTEPHAVCLSVRDSGVGIKPEALPHIFERFYRGDASRSDQGNGLGLSLCESILRAHGGTIQAESTLGHGSVFTISLPN